MGYKLLQRPLHFIHVKGVAEFPSSTPPRGSDGFVRKVFTVYMYDVVVNMVSIVVSRLEERLKA